MPRNLVTIWIISTAILGPVAAFASGLGAVLEGSPFASFSDADYQQFFASVQRAADGPVGGQSIDWSNTASGAHGTVKATRAFRRPEGDCREMKGENTARGRAEPFRVTVCKGKDDKWLLAPNEPYQKPAPPAAVASPGFPAALPASFSGVLPCADCQGIDYALELNADGNYRLRMTYLGRGAGGAGESVDDAGAWQLVWSGERVTLRSDRNTTVTFAIKDADTLRLLDANANEINSTLNYDLKRAAVLAPIAPAELRPSAQAVPKSIYVAPNRRSCTGVAPMRCLQIREQPTDPWRLYYGQIIGFSHEAGFEYQLRILEDVVPNPPADGDDKRWFLDRVVEQRYVGE